MFKKIAIINSREGEMNYQILLYYSNEKNLWVVEQTITNLPYGMYESRDEALQMAERVSQALNQELVIQEKEAQIDQGHISDLTIHQIPFSHSE
jgi:hypothetical protein